MLKGDRVVDRTRWARQSSNDYLAVNPLSGETGSIGSMKKRLTPRAHRARFGGVGFGVFYTNPFVMGWETSTSITEHILVPRNFGGTNPGEIANTQTNGSGHGVEVVLDYIGQNDARMVMYDWSIIKASTPYNYPGGYALIIPWSGLTDYLSNQPCSDGVWRQQLWFYNYTYQVNAATNTWRNLVLFRNYRTYTWDAVYSHQFYWDKVHNDDVSPPDEDGNSAPLGGVWGPILEEVSNQSPSGAFRPQGVQDAQIMRDVDSDDGYFPLNTYMSFFFNLGTDPVFNQSKIYFIPNHSYACGSRANELVAAGSFPGNALDVLSLHYKQGTPVADGLRVTLSGNNIHTAIVDGADPKYPNGWGKIIKGNKYVLQLDLKVDAAFIAQYGPGLAYGLRDSSGVTIVVGGWAGGDPAQFVPNVMQRRRVEFTATSTTIVRPYIWAEGWGGAVTLQKLSLALE